MEKDSVVGTPCRFLYATLQYLFSDDQVVEESLKAASVWNDVKDKLHESALSLSGGQQQRVCMGNNNDSVIFF
jgi:ABC-type phosphate transport system ATPase subunit